MADKPNKSSEMKKELDKIEGQMAALDKQMKDLTVDEMNKAPVREMEPQTKLASKDLEKSKDIYLKPKRTIASKEKFNERFREDYNYSKEYVQFIPEHKEIVGDVIEMWTKPFAGVPAEEWVIPTGKPVWAPRYVAERIKGCQYHRLTMQQHVMTEANSVGQMYGAMAVDSVVQRLDAIPVSTRKSIFMGASSF